jgi:hypothetical protein
LVLELLELEEKEKLKDAAMKLDEYQKSWDSISFFHQYDFLFKAWLALCANEITEEDFIKIGDVDSPFSLYDENKKDANTFFSELKNSNFPKEKIIVIDQDAWNLFLTGKEQSEIWKNLDDNWKLLMLI